MRRTALVALAGLALVVVWLVARQNETAGTSSLEVGHSDRPGREPQPERFSETDRVPLPDVLVDPALLIEKGLRRLTVFSNDAPVKHYRIALGSNPEGDKEREGDGRTPEGDFYVCSRGSSAHYAYTLGISYPAEEDADRGLATGLITRRDHRRIVEAIHRMQRPPWNTPLGGEIMIHEGDTLTDWTAGCIALSERDMAELLDAIPLGTPVRIRP